MGIDISVLMGANIANEVAAGRFSLETIGEGIQERDITLCVLTGTYSILEFVRVNSSCSLNLFMVRQQWGGNFILGAVLWA